MIKVHTPENQESSPRRESRAVISDRASGFVSFAHRTQSAADAPHEQWVEDLCVQLNSMEPTEAGAEDTTRVISGRPVSGIEVSAQLREYFKSAGQTRFYVTQQYTRAGPAARRTRGFANYSQADPFPLDSIHKGYLSLRASCKTSASGEQRCIQV